MRWQVQEAKQRFSELLRAAVAGEPQIVTRHGEEIAVVMDMTEYRRLQRDDQRLTLLEFLRRRPADGEGLDDDLEIERSQEPAREINFFD